MKKKTNSWLQFHFLDFFKFLVNNTLLINNIKNNVNIGF